MTDPELLVLFEDWLEELEEEVVAFMKAHGPLDAGFRRHDDLGIDTVFCGNSLGFHPGTSVCKGFS